MYYLFLDDFKLILWLWIGWSIGDGDLVESYMGGGQFDIKVCFMIFLCFNFSFFVLLMYF